MNNKLPVGFISVEQAVDLIKKDSREHPIIDMDYLIEHSKWIDTGHTFRIPRVRQLPKDKVKISRTQKVIDYETIGEENVYVQSPYEKEMLKKAIHDQYYAEVGHEYAALQVKGRTTVSTDATQGNIDAVSLRAVKKPNTAVGSLIGSGSEAVSNGVGLDV